MQKSQVELTVRSFEFPIMTLADIWHVPQGSPGASGDIKGMVKKPTTGFFKNLFNKNFRIWLRKKNLIMQMAPWLQFLFYEFF